MTIRGHHKPQSGAQMLLSIAVLSSRQPLAPYYCLNLHELTPNHFKCALATCHHTGQCRHYHHHRVFHWTALLETVTSHRDHEASSISSTGCQLNSLSQIPPLTCQASISILTSSTSTSHPGDLSEPGSLERDNFICVFVWRAIRRLKQEQHGQIHI